MPSYCVSTCGPALSAEAPLLTVRGDAVDEVAGSTNGARLANSLLSSHSRGSGADDEVADGLAENVMGTFDESSGSSSIGMACAMSGSASDNSKGVGSSLLDRDRSTQ